MSIPELNNAQYNTLMSICSGNNSYSQIVPNKTLDSSEDFANWTRGTEDTQKLVELGLMKDVSADNQEKLDRIFLMTNRNFRIYETTEVCRAMFSEEPEKRTIH